MESMTNLKSSTVNAPLIIVVAGAQGHLGKLVCDSILVRARSEGRQVLVRGLIRKGSANSVSATPDESPDRGIQQQLTIEPVDYDNDDDLNRVMTGAYCVVSALQGLEEVIVGVQLRLLKVAIVSNVHRFIPSDFSIDFTKLPEGANRNFDLRLQFHQAADRLIQQSKSDIEFTSIYQGAFTELLSSGRMLLDYSKRRVTYFGSPTTMMEFTTWENTAEYTAAVALDPNHTPQSLYIAGKRLSPGKIQQVVKQVSGIDFELKRLMSVNMLRVIIALLRLFRPEKDKIMPMWVGMQYAYCMALGPTLPVHLDNDRYTGIEWTGVEDTIRKSIAKNS